MEEKYINFYKMFDKRFKNNKKSYSLLELSQSLSSKFECGIKLKHDII